MKGEASFVELPLHVVNGARNASACQWGRLKRQRELGLMVLLIWKSFARQRDQI